MTAQDRQVIRDYILHRVVVGWNVVTIAEHRPLLTARTRGSGVSPTMGDPVTF